MNRSLSALVSGRMIRAYRGAWWSPGAADTGWRCRCPSGARPFVVIATGRPPGIITGYRPQSATLEAQVMMPYQSYQLWQAERTTTTWEQHAADVRRGELAAAVSRSCRRAG